MGMNMKMNFIRQRDNMKLKTNLMVSSLMLLIAALTTSCSSTTTSDSNNNLSTRLVIEKAAPIPVLDGQATSTGIYVRNTSSKAITDITYAVVNTNDNNQNLAVNASACRNIAAHSSCLLPIMTPSLELGNSGANLIVASYDGQQSKQLINYRYTRLADYSGINFSDNSQSLYGTNDYATSYVFVGNGQSQANVGFNTSNNSLAIIGGLTNGKVDIPAKSVIALELQSNQNVTSNLVMVTPYTVTTSKGLTAALQLGAQNNSQLQVTITPQQQANLLMSNVGILSASESTATLTLMNNGNKEATTINLNSSSTVDVAIEAAQTNPCGATLAVGASCNYKLKLFNQESNGNVVLTLSYNNARANVQALQSVYYFNNRGAPMVIVAPNQSIFTEGVGTNQNIIFKVENIGGSKLSNMVITPLKNGLTNTTLTVPNNTCGSTLAAESCQFSVNVAASGLIDSGVIYANVKGSAGTTSYSFMSKSVAATITDSAAPSVTSTTPQNTQIGVLASTAIVVNFSEAMKAITLNTTNIMLQKVSDSSVIPLTLQGVTNNNQTVTFTQTSGKLVGFTDYKIVINPSQIQDVNGNALDAGQTESTIATFTTGDTIAPSIVTVNPTNGATNQSRTPTMNITFSESMDQTTLSTSNILLKDGNGTLVSGYTTSYNSATNTVTINLNSNLLSETTYRIILNQTAITDIAGNALGSDGNYVATEFTTGDFTAPTLSSTTPVNGATNVAVESGISLTFSESMDTSTLTDTTIKLQKASDNSDVSLVSPPSYSNGNRTVSLTPTANLANGESYNIVINPSQIKDVAGNTMGLATESVVTNFVTASDNAPLLILSGITGLTSFDGSSLSLQYSGIGGFNNIAYGNGVYVANDSGGGMSPSLLYSTDGLSWTIAKWKSNYNFVSSVKDQNKYIQKITYGGGKFVAVGTQGMIIYSNNGSLWESAASGISYDFANVTYDGTKFIAVATYKYAEVTHNTYKYDKYGSIFLTSTDGVNWSQNSSSQAYRIVNVIYNSSNSKYVAIMVESDTYNNDYYISTANSLNGLFSGVRVTESQAYLSQLAVAGSNTIVAGYGKNNLNDTFIYNSTDGSSFSRTMLSKLQPQAIVYDASAQKFIMVGCYAPTSGGCSSTAGILSSNNQSGSSWGSVSQISPDTPTYSGMVYNGTDNKLVAVTGGKDGGRYSAVSSNDGSTWSYSSAVNSNIPVVSQYAYKQGVYVGVAGYARENMVYYSLDGNSWSNGSTETQTYGLFDVVAAFNKFIAVGYDASYASLIMTSSDGQNWTGVSGVTNVGALSSIIKFKNQLIASSNADSAILTSSDGGATWNLEPVNLMNVLNMAASSTRVVAVGYSTSDNPSSLFYYSDDGFTWHNSTVTSDNITLSSVAYSNGKFVAVGSQTLNGISSAVIYLSDDGITWSQSSSPLLASIISLSNVASFNGGLYAWGASGTLIVSNDNGITWSNVFDSAYMINYVGIGGY